VFDDADAVCHPDILAPCARTNTESVMPLPCCSEQLAAGCNSLILLAPVRGTQQHGFSQKNKWELREVLVLQRLWLAILAGFVPSNNIKALGCKTPSKCTCKTKGLLRKCKTLERRENAAPDRAAFLCARSSNRVIQGRIGHSPCARRPRQIAPRVSL
jgi:hypothetical protein